MHMQTANKYHTEYYFMVVRKLKTMFQVTATINKN